MAYVVEIKKKLSALKGLLRRKYYAEIIGIFGSYARDDNNSDSDIDILVRFIKGASLFDLVGLSDFLEEELDRKVDIVSERGLRKDIELFIRKDLIKI